MHKIFAKLRDINISCFYIESDKKEFFPDPEVAEFDCEGDGDGNGCCFSYGSLFNGDGSGCDRDCEGYGYFCPWSLIERFEIGDSDA